MNMMMKMYFEPPSEDSLEEIRNLFTKKLTEIDVRFSIDRIREDSKTMVLSVDSKNSLILAFITNILLLRTDKVQLNFNYTYYSKYRQFSRALDIAQEKLPKKVFELQNNVGHRSIKLFINSPGINLDSTEKFFEGLLQYDFIFEETSFPSQTAISSMEKLNNENLLQQTDLDEVEGTTDEEDSDNGSIISVQISEKSLGIDDDVQNNSKDSQSENIARKLELTQQVTTPAPTQATPDISDEEILLVQTDIISTESEAVEADTSVNIEEENVSQAQISESNHTNNEETFLVQKNISSTQSGVAEQPHAGTTLHIQEEKVSHAQATEASPDENGIIINKRPADTDSSLVTKPDALDEDNFWISSEKYLDDEQVDMLRGFCVNSHIDPELKQAVKTHLFKIILFSDLSEPDSDLSEPDSDTSFALS